MNKTRVALLGAEFIESGCDVVDVCRPNFLHAGAVIKAAQAGQHVSIEKPLALTLEEADAMIEACRTSKRKLMDAEELCFAPKYERTRKLVAEGAVGAIYQLRQVAKPVDLWLSDSR